MYIYGFVCFVPGIKRFRICLEILDKLFCLYNFRSWQPSRSHAANLADPTPEAAVPAAGMHAAATPTPASREAAVSTAASFAAATPTAAGAAPAATAGEKFIAVEAAARPEGAATAALRERSKLAAFERRASSRSLVLARRREGSQPGTPENLRCAEEEASNFDVSLDLEDRESVFSPAPGDMDGEPVEWANTEAPLLAPKKVELSEQEKREIETDLEKLAERLAATLSAACSKKKKRR